MRNINRELYEPMVFQKTVSSRPIFLLSYVRANASYIQINGENYEEGLGKEEKRLFVV